MIRTFLRRLFLLPIIPLVYLIIFPLLYLLTNDPVPKLLRDVNSITTDFWTGHL